MLDPNRWLLPMKRVYHIAGVESAIPCKPTHPDISILLLKKKFFKKTLDGHSAVSQYVTFDISGTCALERIEI